MPISRGALYGDRTCLGRGRVETDPDGGWGFRETHPTSLRYARSKSHGSHRLEHYAKDRPRATPSLPSGTLSQVRTGGSVQRRQSVSWESTRVVENDIT